MLSISCWWTTLRSCLYPPGLFVSSRYFGSTCSRPYRTSLFTRQEGGKIRSGNSWSCLFLPLASPLRLKNFLLRGQGRMSRHKTINNWIWGTCQPYTDCVKLETTRHGFSFVSRSGIHFAFVMRKDGYLDSPFVSRTHDGRTSFWGTVFCSKKCIYGQHRCHISCEEGTSITAQQAYIHQSSPHSGTACDRMDSADIYPIKG